MASVESDHTAHVIFKVQQRFFKSPSLLQPRGAEMLFASKNPFTNKAWQMDFTNHLLQ